MRKGTLIVVGVALLAVTIGVFFFYRGDFSKEELSTIADNQQSAVAIPFTELARGSRSTVTKRVNYFITSPVELSELWNMIDADGAPPEVDFEEKAVIAVFAGERPTTGYAISVAKVEDSDARLVSITIEKPDNSCVVGQSLTTPYEIVAIPATTLPLSHEDISATKSCSN